MFGLHLSKGHAFPKRLEIAEADEMRQYGFRVVPARIGLPFKDHAVVDGEPCRATRPRILPNTSWKRHFAFVYERQGRVGINAFVNSVALRRAE